MCGNSLISGSPKELKKYFGKDWKRKEAFNWTEKFSEIFKGKNPGFDIVIGNPPWVTLLHKDIEGELDYLKDNYSAAQGFKLNLFPIFVERALQLCKKEGYVAFIIPNRLLDTPSYKKIREKIIKKYNVEFIVNIPRGSFEDVVAGNIIICIKKTSPQRKSIKIIEGISNGEEKCFDIPISEIAKNDYVINVNLNPAAESVLNKIAKESILLKKIAEPHVGMMIKEKKEVLKQKAEKELNNMIVKGRDIGRYAILNKYYFNPHKVDIFGGTKDFKKHAITPKIFVRKTGDRIIATLDKEGIFAEQSVYLVLLKKSISPEFILAMLNSKLLTFYFRNRLITNPEVYPYLQHYDLEKIPIYKISLSDKKEKIIHSELKRLVREMLKANKEIQKLHPEMDDKEYNELKLEIEVTDKLIDQKVYELYGLINEEIKIVEEDN